MYAATGQPQYATGVPAQPMTTPTQWSTGLCACGDDCSTCCLTFWCPCITFGRIAEVVDKGTTSCGVHGAFYSILYLFTGCQCIYSCIYRSKMRQQYMLSEQPCNDCLVHCCCELCALCQEYRELKYRGIEPSLGWEGNLAKQNWEANLTRQNQGDVMSPVRPKEMER